MKPKYNVTYEKRPFPTIYKQMTLKEMLEVSDKGGFKAFVFQHKPTRIAMVTIVDNMPVIGKFNS